MNRKSMPGRGLSNNQGIKRLAAKGDPDAIIALLNRSISFKHERLAIFRYHLMLALCEVLTEKYAPYSYQARRSISAEEATIIANRARDRARSLAVQRGWIAGPV